jgi:hypothetical protein
MIDSSTFDDLAKLETNWDSYGAAAIDPRALHAATKLIKGMHLVPTSDGGLQLEVCGLGMEIEIGINPDGTGAVLLTAQLRQP